MVRRHAPKDLIAQAIIQELFDMTPRVDLVDYARIAAARARNDRPDLVHEWQLARRPPASNFVGTHNLFFRVNDMPSQTARLRHYHEDVWTWLPESRDAAVRMGAEFYLSLQLVLLSFVREGDGIVALDWDLQAGTCEGPAPGLDVKVKPIRLLRQTSATSATTATQHDNNQRPA